MEQSGGDARNSRLAATYQAHRRELVVYLSRLVVQPAVAEEIAQESMMRLLQQGHVGEDTNSVRAWLYRVSTNLAFDHLRRYSTKRELPLLEVREHAEANPDFVHASVELRGSPETQAIAREHLIACFACTLKTLPPRHAAALLLKEVQGFSTQETADLLGARVAQAKNWIQDARREMTRRFSTTCALVAKKGVCHQCLELDQSFNGQSRHPLNGRRSLNARLKLLREMKAILPGPWHLKLFDVFRDIIG